MARKPGSLQSLSLQYPSFGEPGTQHPSTICYRGAEPGTAIEKQSKDPVVLELGRVLQLRSMEIAQGRTGKRRAGKK